MDHVGIVVNTLMVFVITRFLKSWYVNGEIIW
jgi:hypothetical protein